MESSRSYSQVVGKSEDIIETTMEVDGDHVVVEEVQEVSYGEYIGNTKWFNDKLGYGFVTICDGQDKGKDIFVHNSGIKPLNSNYKTLRKGEYIQFNIITGMNGLQAVDVTGVKGGPLMCDYITIKKPYVEHQQPPPPPPSPSPQQQWQNVQKRPRVEGDASTFGGKPKPTSKYAGGVKNTAKYNKNKTA